MLATQFDIQMARLRVKFGEPAYDVETSMMVWRVVQDADIDWFKKQVDQCIATRRRNDPPLPEWFSEQVKKELHFKFQYGQRKLAELNIMSAPRSPTCTDGGWSEVVKALGPCENAMEAVEKLQIRMELNRAHKRDEYHGLDLFNPVLIEKRRREQESE